MRPADVETLSPKARTTWLESEVQIKREASLRLAKHRGTVVRFIPDDRLGLFARVELHKPVKRHRRSQSLFLIHVRNLVFIRIGPADKDPQWPSIP